MNRVERQCERNSNAVVVQARTRPVGPGHGSEPPSCSKIVHKRLSPVTSRLATGVIGYRPGPTMASSDKLKITVLGRQAHGAAPWLGVDPIVTAAQLVLGLQTVVSRTIDLTEEPAVVTLGTIHGGVRENIIPDSVEMRGTILTFNEDMRDDIHERFTTLAEAVSRNSRAGCKVCIEKNYPGDHQRPCSYRSHAAHAASCRR